MVNLGRRGFFGLLAGAAVAGPSVAQKAMANIASGEAMNLGGLMPLPGHFDGGYPPDGAPGGQVDWAHNRLLRYAMRTATQHAYHRERTSVHHLDGDLVANRSFSLATKVRMQRARNYEQSMAHERGYLEATIAGWFND
jgi:hypothetical protein